MLGLLAAVARVCMRRGGHKSHLKNRFLQKNTILAPKVTVFGNTTAGRACCLTILKSVLDNGLNK
jgi:hypothetical protein